MSFYACIFMHMTILFRLLRLIRSHHPSRLQVSMDCGFLKKYIDLFIPPCWVLVAACGIFQLWRVSSKFPDQGVGPRPTGAWRLSSSLAVREAPAVAYISLMSLNVGSTVLVIERTLNKASFNDWLATCSFLCQPRGFPGGSDVRRRSAQHTGLEGFSLRHELDGDDPWREWQSSVFLLESMDGGLAGYSHGVARSWKLSHTFHFRVFLESHLFGVVSHNFCLPTLLLPGVQSDRSLRSHNPKDSESWRTPISFKFISGFVVTVFHVWQNKIYLSSVLGGPRFRENIPYCVLSAACRGSGFYNWLCELDSPVGLPVCKRQADSPTLALVAVLPGTALRAGVKIWFPFSHRSEVHNASQPSFNLFCFVRWWR